MGVKGRGGEGAGRGGERDESSLAVDRQIES